MHQFVLLLIGSLFIRNTLATPLSRLEQLSSDYNGIVPPKVQAFFSNLSENDTAIFQEVEEKYANYTSEDEVLDELKQRSPSLYENVKKIHENFERRLISMDDEAQLFVREVLHQGKLLIYQESPPTVPQIQLEAVKTLKRFRNLTDNAQKEVKEQFPILASLLEHPRLQELEALVDHVTNNTTVPSAPTEVSTTANDTVEPVSMMTSSEEELTSPEDITPTDEEMTSSGEEVTSSGEELTAEEEEEEDATSPIYESSTPSNETITSSDETMTSSNETMTSSNETVTSSNETVTSSIDLSTSSENNSTHPYEEETNPMLLTP